MTTKTEFEIWYSEWYGMTLFKKYSPKIQLVAKTIAHDAYLAGAMAAREAVTQFVKDQM